MNTQKTVRDLLDNLEGGAVLHITPPKIAAMITGVVDCRINRQGIIRLMYEGGTEEMRQANKAILDMASEDWTLFKLVDYVQAGRGKTENMECISCHDSLYACLEESSKDEWFECCNADCTQYWKVGGWTEANAL